MNTNEVLKLANEALKKAIDERKQNQEIIKNLGPAIVETLKPALDNLNENSKIVKDELLKAVQQLSENVSGIKMIPGKDGKDVDEEKIIKKITEAILKRIPTPKDGKDGKDADIVDKKQIIKEILRQIPKPQNGKDATVNIDEIIGKLLTKIPVPKDGQDGSVDTGEEIVSKVNKLPLNPNVMIDASHIKNLSYPVLLSAGGKRIKGRQVRDDLSSQCDGSNKTFTLTKKFISNTVQLFSTQFPIVYRPVVDFTENSNGTLTLTAEVGAPASGQTLVALYEKYI